MLYYIIVRLPLRWILKVQPSLVFRDGLSLSPLLPPPPFIIKLVKFEKKYKIIFVLFLFLKTTTT